jgi:hypothetical protein
MKSPNNNVRFIKITKLAILTMFMIFNISNSIGQSENTISLKNKIDSLENQIKFNDSRIVILNKSNESLNNTLKPLLKEYKERLLKENGGEIYICVVGTLLYEKPDGGKPKSQIRTGNKVNVIEVLENYYKVYFESDSGYVNKAGFKSVKQIEQENNSINQQQIAEQERIKRYEKQREIELEEKRTNLIKKYGEKIGQKIFQEEIWIGMTSEMVIDSQGRPKDINKTVGSWGVHEQWVYENNTYLYLENDRLTSWQY